jgi:mRNA interferase MazF
MGRKIIRGDIYYAELDPVMGSEQGGLRPVLVLQNNRGNAYSPTIIVAAITTREKPQLPSHLSLSSVPELKAGSALLLEQLRTIDKLRLRRYIDSAPPETMRLVDTALAVSLGLCCPVKPPATLMTLCPVCKGDFEAAGFHLRRRGNTGAKDTCDYCNTRRGFDFAVEGRA